MPERIVSPHDAAAQPLIERITQPLYDCLTLDGDAVLPGSPMYWFTSPIGGAELNGNTSKTPLHTNMEVSGQLPNPRLFTIMGISVTVSAFTSGVVTIGANEFMPINLLEDLKRIYYYSSYQLRVGNKEYVNTPMVNVPSNYGAEGCAIYDDSVVADAAANYLMLRDYFQSTGRHHAVVKKPITIAPQQTFRTSIFFDTGPDAFAVGGLNTPGQLSGDRRAWNLLHGELGREVQ